MENHPKQIMSYTILSSLVGSSVEDVYEELKEEIRRDLSFVGVMPTFEEVVRDLFPGRVLRYKGQVLERRPFSTEIKYETPIVEVTQTQPPPQTPLKKVSEPEEHSPEKPKVKRALDMNEGKKQDEDTDSDDDEEVGIAEALPPPIEDKKKSLIPTLKALLESNGVDLAKITVEERGSSIIISGETKMYNDQLRLMGCAWNRSLKQWNITKDKVKALVR